MLSRSVFTLVSFVLRGKNVWGRLTRFDEVLGGGTTSRTFPRCSFRFDEVVGCLKQIGFIRI